MTFLRARGVRGYLTLNTLLFNDELAAAERVVRLAVDAGIDAVLVQDLGLLRLIHRLCPELPLHASTQMTLSSAENIREIEPLGVRRVVLPRELSIEQIAAIHRQTDVELETFVHGALCISFSGQCLASLSLGGRSANRGQCAQPCRLPYEVLVGQNEVIPSGKSLFLPADKKANPAVSTTESADTRYPLSPHDLAAYDRLPQLIAAGVSALKIEGRLKSAEYVACVTRHYRSALDAICADAQEPRIFAQGHCDTAAIADLERTFSRGFCHGWLDGDDHQALVSGDNSGHRGTYLGVVSTVRGDRVVVDLVAPVRRGDGVLFEGAEQGGRVYEVFQGGRSIADEVPTGMVELAFRYGAIDAAKIGQGQKVWKTNDPQAARRLRKDAIAASRQRRVAVDMTIEASVGRPLRLSAVAATGASCSLESPGPSVEADKHPLTVETLTEQFGRLGKTPYVLRHVEARIDGRPMIPLSILGKLRHELVRQLDAATAQPPHRTTVTEPVLPELRCLRSSAIPRLAADDTSAKDGSRLCYLHVLCRTLEQIGAALSCDVSSIIVDLSDVRGCAEAVQAVRSSGVEAWPATSRIHKPGETEAFEMLARCRPDGVLARNLAGLAYFRGQDIPVVAEFSLNAANDLTVDWLLSQGAVRVTAAYDLSRERLLKLADTVAPNALEVVVHRHTPMFHTEYCLYCRSFSQGKDQRDCGRPCRRRTLRLRDRLGVEHPVLVDSQCRNTVFHAEAESLSKAIPSLQSHGIRHFRVELLDECEHDQVRRVIDAHRPR